MKRQQIQDLLREATDKQPQQKAVHFWREAWPPHGYVGKIELSHGTDNEKALDRAFAAFNGMDDNVHFAGPSASVGDIFVIETSNRLEARKIARFGFEPVDHPRALAEVESRRLTEILKPEAPRSPAEEARMIDTLYRADAVSRAQFEPIGIYEYRADGRYQGANWVNTPEAFAEMIPRLSQHIEDGKELRITDTSDRLLFQAKDKKIEWDGIGISPLLDSAKKAQERAPER